MGKQEIKQRETHLSSNNGVGKEIEQTFTVDDNSLPSAQELKAYKDIDPRIVDFLIDASVKEQAHRHEMDRSKMNIVKKSENRIRWTNWWGMFYAFLSILVLGGLTAFALYLDRPWFAGFMGLTTFVSVASIFINSGNKDRASRK